MNEKEINWDLHAEVAGISSLLAHGMELINKTDWQNFGNYYPMLTCLSNGLERLLKLILFLKWKVKIQKDHNISKLFNDFLQRAKIKENDKSNKVNINLMKFSDEIYINIIEFLSSFAIRERYKRLDIITDESCKKNTMTIESNWYKNVVSKIIDRHKIAISTPRQLGIINSIDKNSFVFLRNHEENTIYDNIKECIEKNSLLAKQKKFLRLYVGIILRELSYYFKSIDDQTDMLSELLQKFMLEDDLIKKRKKWS